MKTLPLAYTKPVKQYIINPSNTFNTNILVCSRDLTIPFSPILVQWCNIRFITYRIVSSNAH